MSFNSYPLLQNTFGSFNYLLNGNFDRLDTFAAQVTGASKWNAYKGGTTTPTSGTGGSPTVINNAVVSSGVLRGIRSWQITKTGNAQGEGYSSDFTIDQADTGKALSISFDYSAGSAYTTGDLVLYIYDITNSTLITPNITSLPQTSGFFSATWAATTSTSYRIIFHCAATNVTTSNWSMTLDNIRVSNVIFQPGTPTTDWLAYTPTITGFGTVSGNTAFYKRIGDTVQVIGRFVCGTPSATNAQVSLPSGLSLDSTKLVATQANFLGSFARAVVSSTNNIPNTTAGPWPITDNGTSGTNIAFSISTNTTSGGTFIVTNGNNVANSGDWISYNFFAPIAQWSSTANFVVNQTEYAYNTAATTSAGGSDTSSFANGPAGQAFNSFNSNTGSGNSVTTLRVQFQNNIQPTDFLIPEVQLASGGPWYPAEVIIPHLNINTTVYGIGISTSNPASNQADVVFGNGGASTQAVSSYAGTNGDPWSGWTSRRWRIRKSSGPQPTQLSGQIVGTGTNDNALAGYIGEVQRSAITSATNISTTTTWQNLTTITLSAGDWDVSAGMNFNLNGATTTACAMAVSINSGNTTTDHQVGDNEFDVLAPTSGAFNSASCPAYRISVAAGTTQTVYLKGWATFSAGNPQMRGRISARRIR